MKSIIHHGFSRCWLGVGMSLVAAAAVHASTQVTFMVDMVNETTTPTNVYVTGSFPEAGPWSEFSTLTLINTSGTIWSNTFTLSDPIGTVESVKFNDDVTGWEPSANREFLLGTTGDTSVPGTEVLPLATWNSASTWPTPTNSVTFQVDMSAQVLLGNFNNSDPARTVTVSGDFEGWDSGLPLTNNPSLSGSVSNVYSAALPVVGFQPVGTIHYKFRMNGGWENDFQTTSKNRESNITQTPQVLPLVYYNDNSVYDLVSSPIKVTFSLYMTNGSQDVNGYAFQKGTDLIYINGNWLNNGNWNSWGLGDGLPAEQMIEVGDSDVYTNSQVIPTGGSIDLDYKYSLNGFDDENGFQTNHFRLIRSYGPTYVIPQDVWSWNVLQPGNGNPDIAGIANTNIIEPDFGYLAVGAQSGGKLPITWLGRPGVILQSSAFLNGSWTDNNGTDASMSTNWPVTVGNQFFRLEKKQ